MLKSTVVLLALSLVFVACKKDDDNSGNGGNQQNCYTNTNAQELVHDGVNREYVIYVPDSYDGSSAVPLMLMFHGFGGEASDFMSGSFDGNSDLRSIAESDTFLLVYPQGSCSGGSSHWNPCPAGPGNKSEADDLGFVETLINSLSGTYNVDLERVYAAGYSNGGMMAYGLANYKSNLIAAVASVSGVMLDCTANPSHPMPVLHLHGTDDAVLPYNGNGDYSSAQSTIDHWVGWNNCVTTPVVNSDNSGGLNIEHFVYDQGDSLVSVEHYKYNGGGHVWFDAQYQGKSASMLVWDFVSQYDINGLR